MDKYALPNLPTPQHVLEDASDSEILNLTYSFKLQTDDEALQNAYSCFQNCKQLEADSVKQNDLNIKLQELNKKLLESIANMKAQTK